MCVYMKERERESSLIGIVWVARAQCQQQPQWFPTSLQRHHRKGGGTLLPGQPQYGRTCGHRPHSQPGGLGTVAGPFHRAE